MFNLTRHRFVSRMTERLSVYLRMKSTAMLAVLAFAAMGASGAAQAGNDATFVSQTLPTTMVEGETYYLFFSFKNTGTTSWTAATVSATLLNSPGWSRSQIVMTAGTTVPVNSQYTFSGNFVAPPAGTYGMQWCPTHSTAGQFGQCSPYTVVTVQPRIYDAQFVSQTTFTSMTGSRGYSITMRNTGNVPWGNSNLVQIGTISPNDNTTWGINRIKSFTGGAVGATATFTATVTPPAVGGYYDMQWQMLDPKGKYFGEVTPNQHIATAEGPPSVSIQSPAADEKFIAVANYIDVPIRVVATPTGIATITKIQLLTYNASTQLYTEIGSALGDTYEDVRHIFVSTTSTITYYVKATDSFGKATQVPLVINGIADNGYLSTSTVPATMVPSQPYDVTLTFKNSGGTTWEPGTVELVAQNPADDSLWGISSMPLTQSVAPNGTVVFSGHITAPPDVATKTFQWRLRHSTRGLFGTQTSIAVNVARPLPVVTLTTPTAGQIFDLPSGTTADVLFQGTAVAGTAATISKIDVLEGVTVLATAQGTSMNQTVPLKLGAHTIRLRATDNWGIIGYSSFVTVNVKGNDATFISQSVPATMQVGKTYTASITMRNDGGRAWAPATAGTPDSYALGSQNPENNTIWRPNRVMTTTTVNPGAQVTFSVPITAPTIPGTYNFQWKMTQEGREWFGDPSTNVAVVVKPPLPSLGVLTAPVAGQKIIATGGKASVHFQATATAGEGGTITKLEVLNSTVTVASAPSGTLDADFDLTPGTYILKLRATDNFGQVVTDTVTTTVTVLSNNATVVSRTSPSTMTAGQTYPVTIVMRNSGTSTWTTEDGYELAATDELNTWGIVRVPLPTAVPPNGTATFTFNVTAPNINGTFPFMWQMRRFGYEWFGAKSGLNVPVTGAVPIAVLDSPTEGATFDADSSGNAQVRVQGHSTPGTLPIVRIYVFMDGRIPYFVDADIVDVVLPIAIGAHNMHLVMVDSAQGNIVSPSVNFTVRGNAAEFVSQTPLSNLFAGERQTISVTMRNTGTTTWEPGDVQGGTGFALVSDNPQDNQVWGIQRAPLSAAVAPGSETTFSFEVTAPKEPGTYPIQWRLLDLAGTTFGVPSTQQMVTVTRRPPPLVSLSASPTNVRVAPGQRADITLAASATAGANGGNQLGKLELFQDTGSGYGSTPVRSVAGPATTLNLDGPMALAGGNYRLLLRVTDSEGTVVESAPVLVNVTDSSLLGLVSGVRSNDAGQLQLVGWACRSGSDEALSYQVYANAPPALGGILLGGGTANASGQPSDAAVREQCGTTGSAHNFIVDLASLQAPNPGAPLYVRASAATGENVLLPCEDHGCRMPEGLRIGLTSPNANNLDRFRTPQPAFLRAVVSGLATAPDEVSFEIDGQALPAVAEDGSAWSASKGGLAARAVPYVAVAKVRQGDTIVISEERQFYIDPPIEPGTVSLPNGSVGLNQPITLSTVINAAVEPGQSVKFFIVKRATTALRFMTMAATATTSGETIGDAVFDGSKWTYVWTPAAAGTYEVTAKLLAADGTVLMQTPTATITVNTSTTPSDATPLPVNVPPLLVLANGEGGTLPGAVSVGSSGNAGYSIPIQVPPGILGMAPAISLNYDSNSPTGSSGLGWSIGGFAHIERCGKVIGTDGTGDGVRFVPADRLCLNGQRLVLVSGAANDDTAYWADEAEYRTEVEQFARVKSKKIAESGRRWFQVESKDGRISNYGDTDDSYIEGTGRSDGLAHRWYMSRSSDRSGNTISYTYSKDAVTGENKPASVSWGANNVQKTPDFAKISFVYEARPDARLAYLAGSRLDERLRLKKIETSVDTSNDNTGTWVPALTYTLAYKQSPSSGRSLLQSVTACDVERCLPATTLRYGERDPAAVPGFVPLGGDRTGPNLDAMMHESSLSLYENIVAADFNGDGRTDLLELFRLTANGSTQHMYESNSDGSGWTESTPLAGVPHAQSVLEVADFDGDGLPDLLVADSDGKWYICPGRLRSAGSYNCDTPAPLPADAMVIRPNVKLRIARDFNADGKDDLFLLTAPKNEVGYKAYQCLSTGTGFECIPVTGTQDEKLLGDDRRGEPWGPNIYTDVDGDGRADVLLIPKCEWTLPLNERFERWVCGSTSFGPGNGGITAYSEPERGAIKIYRGWLPFPNKQTGIVPQLRNGTLVGDVNGDGYSDMVLGSVSLNSNGTISAGEGILCLSQGHGDGDCRPLPLNGLVNGIDRNYLPLTVGDFDGDGVVDVLRPIEDSWNNTNITQGYQLCHLGTDAASVSGDFPVVQRCEPWSGPTFHTLSQGFIYDGGEDGVGGINSSFLGDFDGDGKQDIVTYAGGNVWRLHSAAHQAKPDEALDKLVSVTNGLGNVERIDYALPNDSLVYSPTVARPDGNNAVGKLIYPARPLVKAVHRDNGPSGTRDTTYRYARMAMDGAGRGNLGFAETSQTDMQRGITTTTWPCLDFPYIGSECASRQVLDVSGTVLNDVTDEWATVPYTQPSGAVTTAPYLRKSTVVRRDLNNYDFGKTVNVVDVIDPWGNVLDTTTTSSSDTNPLGWTVRKVMEFDNNSDGWLLGKMRKLTETRINDYKAVARQTLYTYDANGLLATELRDSSDLTQRLLTTYERASAFGQITKQTLDWHDPAGGMDKTRVVSEMIYTANGRFVSSVKNAMGHLEQRSFDARTGRPASITTANGLTSLMTSDGFGRELSILTPEGNTVETSYRNCASACPVGAAQVTVKEAKRVGDIRTAPPVLRFADSANHVLRTLTWGFDGTQVASDVRYDELGRSKEVYWPRYVNDSEALDSVVGEPANAILRSVSTYDVWDRPWIIQTPDEKGDLQSTTHTWRGFEHKTQNPALQEISELRDVWGKLWNTMDAKGNTTLFAFDPFGNLARTTDPLGNVVLVSYDDWGRRIGLQDPDLGTVSYEVDPLGQVWKQVSPKQYASGSATLMQYDALGRMTMRSAADSVATWTYDVLSGTDCASMHSCGQLVQSKTVAGGTVVDYVQQHTYDALGRPDTTTALLDVLYTIRLKYDDWGRLISEEHQRGSEPAKAYARRYNAWAQLERIERNGQAIWTASVQDAAGRVTGATLGNGLYVEQNFNQHTGRLFHGTVGSQLAEGYTYDVLGNVKDRTQQWGAVSFTETFEYDVLNRLRQSTIAGTQPQVFTYDDIGNILSKTGVGSGDYVYPAAGQERPHAVTNIPGLGDFKYDANGNLESGDRRIISWNSFDMPVTISRDGNPSTFYYGPDHQRVKQLRGSTTVWYAGAMEVEAGSTGTVVKTYLPNALGVEIDKGGNTQLYYTHRDRLGSVMAMSDQGGALSETLAYDSWGKRREQATPATPDSLAGLLDNKGFTGHEMLDQLDLVHMNGRVYDPLVARFMSADPIIQEPEHSQSYNRYSYVWNNPTNLTDPTGFEPETPPPPPAPSPNSVVPCNQSSTCTKWLNYIIAQLGGTRESSPTTGADKSGQRGRVDSAAADKTADPLSYESLMAGEAKREAEHRAAMIKLWGDAADYWGQKQTDTGNGLYSVPGTLATMLSDEASVEKIDFAVGLIGATRGVKSGAGKLGVPDEGFVPSQSVSGPYSRPSRAGPTTEQWKSVQGKPCADCGALSKNQVADHKDPLVVQHYREGKVNVEQQRRVDAVQPHCPSCSAKQGGLLSNFSRAMKKVFGF